MLQPLTGGLARRCVPPAIAVAMSISTAFAIGWKDSPAVGDIFRRANVAGTFVMHDPAADTCIGHDKVRAEKRFVPASTFKIPNSLIGLSVGVVTNADQVLPYRGDPRPFVQAWAKDMGLREAIALSNVPIYQELARRIGLRRMQENLSRLDYGNNELGDSVDTFWLTGPLKISAVEQTRFLAKLARGALPFPNECQRCVREIVQLDRGGSWKLYGKTGWQNAPDQGIGWWVGWVDKEARVYAFALNMDIREPADAGKRVELGKACLKALGIL